MQAPKAPGYRYPTLSLRTATLAAATLALTSTAWAWQPKAYYPSGFEPTMPDADEARRMVGEPPLLLRPLLDAHRQSQQRSWQGGIAVSPENRFNSPER
jgi:hypothetical protein